MLPSPLRERFVALLTLTSLLASVIPAPAQTESLRVGVSPSEPLVIREDTALYDGLAVALWEVVAGRAALPYVYVEVARDSVAARFASNDLDVYLVATPATSSRDTGAHSPIYYSSSLAVARRSGNSITKVLQGLFNPTFFRIVGSLSLLLLVVGTLIYLAERKDNEEQFGGKVHEGVGAGFWWAGVTLTTIGYGDKTPSTLPGRVVAMLWMLVGLAISSVLTATLVSLANAKTSPLKLPGDLREQRTITLADDAAARKFLDRQSIAYGTVPDLANGFERIKADSADLFLAPHMEFEYYLTNSSSSLEIQASRLEPDYYAFSFRQNLPQADTLSALVDEVIRGPVWPTWLGRYVPGE